MPTKCWDIHVWFDGHSFEVINLSTSRTTGYFCGSNRLWLTSGALISDLFSAPTFAWNCSLSFSYEVILLDSFKPSDVVDLEMCIPGAVGHPGHTRGSRTVFSAGEVLFLFYQRKLLSIVFSFLRSQHLCQKYTRITKHVPGYLFMHRSLLRSHKFVAY